MKKAFLLLIILIIFSGCEKKEEKVKEYSYSLISSYETKIYDKIPDRNINLTICANAINGYILPPDKIFSFNDIVGERTYEKGYRDAVIYNEKGEKEMDVGGGICQISTTLHMAAKNAGLNITERHNHKREVPYEALGNDAAVSFNGQDFKFKNNSQAYIKLEVIINNDIVKANIYKRED